METLPDCQPPERGVRLTERYRQAWEERLDRLDAYVQKLSAEEEDSWWKQYSK
jgi:hypothetical protein